MVPPKNFYLDNLAIILWYYGSIEQWHRGTWSGGFNAEGPELLPIPGGYAPNIDLIVHSVVAIVPFAKCCLVTMQISVTNVMLKLPKP